MVKTMKVPDDMIRKPSEKRSSSDGFWTIVFGVFIGNLMTILFVALLGFAMIGVISNMISAQFKPPRMMQNR